MNIAIVCFYLDAPGGTQRQVFSLANTLQEEGHAVTIFTSQFEKKFFPELHKDLAVKVVTPDFSRDELFGATTILQTVVKKWRRDKAFIQFAKKIADALGPDVDVVNSHDYDAYKVGYFYKQRNPNARHVWMMNEIPFSYTPKRNILLEIGRRLYDAYLQRFEKKYFASIDRVATLNEFDAAWVRKTFDLNAQLVESGCNGKDFHAPIHPPVFDKKAPIRLLGMGICAPYRRFEDIIEAAALLRSDRYPIEVTIVGTNASATDGYPDVLVELAYKRGISDHVRFDFKSISDAELKRYYADSHIFVFPTYVGAPRNGYGWGLAAFEAMAAGLPVILCNTTASTRLLEDGTNAFLVDPKSPKQIAEKIKTLISSEKSYHRVADAGQQLALHRVTWQSYAHQMLALFAGQNQ